jgi:PmbA protein
MPKGAATRDRELIENGVLSGYVLGGYAARRLKLETTGNAGGLHDLLVDVADGVAQAPRRREELLREMDSSLMVTE